jgi:hypothetical protein
MEDKPEVALRVLESRSGRGALATRELMQEGEVPQHKQGLRLADREQGA